MIFIMDLGNDSLFRCLFDTKAKAQYRTYCDKRKSEGEYQLLRKQYLAYQSVRPEEIEGAILSSVVPSRTNRIKNAASRLLGKECLVVNHSLKIGLAIRMDNPSEVGSDLLADCVGARKKGTDNYFIADLSSVSSFIVCTSKKEFYGGALFPGRMSSSSYRWQNSAQLCDIELEKPKRLIGKSTKESRNSGILFGYSRLCRERKKKRESERGTDLIPILTGSCARLIKDRLFDFTYDPDLTFEGLAEIYKKNQKGENK